MTERPYLQRLLVENLVVIERAVLDLDPGLNVLTGETGAGKTVLAKAFDLLLGAKTPKGVVRPGADDAYIEGTFGLPRGWLAECASADVQALVDDVHADEVVLARRISASGRSRCLIDGRVVNLDALRDLARPLISFFGQHEQRKLMVEQVQAELLDRSGDRKGAALADAYRTARRASLAADRALADLQERDAADSRARDLARFELDELRDVDPQPSEEREIEIELRRLEQAQEAQQVLGGAVHALTGDDADACGLVSQAARLLGSLDDPQVAALAERLQAAIIELSDIADDAAGLADGWEADPQRAAQMTARLERFADLQRKHRCDYDGLLARRIELEEQVAAADRAPADLQALQENADRCRADLSSAAEQLSKWRAKQAPKLSKSITAALGDLAFQGAAFRVRLDELGGDSPYGEQGAERVVFCLQANPGLPEEELARVASGGEASRVMVALISASGLADGGLLVLDEPDTGLGGHTAHGVAERLVALAERQQTFVISHLPQIAARASAHFVLDKRVDGQLTTTTIDRLEDEDEVVAELCRMTGLTADDHGAASAARKLRALAA